MYSNIQYNNFVRKNTTFTKNAIAEKSGRIQPAFRKFLRENGAIHDGGDILKPLAKAWNPKTGRIVKRSTMYTQKGALRKRFASVTKKTDTSKFTKKFYASKYEKYSGTYEGQLINSYTHWFKLFKESKHTGDVRVFLKADAVMDLQEFQDSGHKNYIVNTVANIPVGYTRKQYDNEGVFFQFKVSSKFFNIIAYVLHAGVNCEVIITKMTDITPKQYEQAYAEGGHCLLGPIRTWAYNQVGTAKSKTAKKRYETILTRLDGKTLKTGEHRPGLLETYADGLPADKIKEVCDELQIAVSIEEPLSHQIYISCRSMKKPLKHFKYLNTRMNHVDQLTSQMREDCAGDDMTYQEMEELLHEFRQEGKHCTYSRNGHGVGYIQTMDETYRAACEYTKAEGEFMQDNNIYSYRFDALEYPQLYEFVSRGTHFNGTTDYTELPELDTPDLRHIDIKKAYTQYQKCKLYEKFGLFGKITDFRKCTTWDQPGMYYIRKVDTSGADARFNYYNEKMGWCKSHNIYTSAELQMFHDMGVTFKVSHGAFGPRCDFEFTDKMINGKQTIKKGACGVPDTRISYYAKCVGKWASTSYSKGFCMYGDRDYFESMTSHAEGVAVRFDEYNGEGYISYPKNQVYTLKHLTAQITAYQRLLIMEQLLDMKKENVIRVCVDGIYYHDHTFEMGDTFADKTHEMTFANSPTEAYLSSIFDKETDRHTDRTEELTRGGVTLPDGSCVGLPRPYAENELWEGQGGTGKTYTNIGDLGLIKPLYVAPAWKLARRVQNDIKDDPGANKTIDVNVLHRVLHMEFSDKLQSKYNVFLFDEVSQYTEAEMRACRKIPGKKIFMGDIGYQLECIINHAYCRKWYTQKSPDMPYFEWLRQEGQCEASTDPELFDLVVKCTTDRRAQNCKVLQTVKRKLRTFSRRARYAKTPESRAKINADALEYLKGYAECVTQKEVFKRYDVRDMVLCSKHEHIKEINEGLQHLEKYLVKNNTEMFSNSEIIYEPPPPGVKAVKTHAYTVHAIQGETLGHTETLFIDIRDMFSDRMLYTAVSRARRMEQVKLIISE